ncbi:hypothetical protein FRC10_009510 [Ceratobasidium sp. 414]|nr:hypothetical protein FRC10_009510 [Ceratobasidium sp. 414]
MSNLNLNEKKADTGFLSPSAWKTRFSMPFGKNTVPGGRAEQREPDVEMSPAPTPSASPRREVWDDREPTGFVMVADNDLEGGRSGPGFVTIGAPPASKKRTSNRTRVVNGVEVSQQRSSVLGRIFGAGGTESRERDMEVTVTITTQLDPLEHLDEGSRASLDGTSMGGGGSAICGKSEGGSVHEDMGAEKAQP